MQSKRRYNVFKFNRIRENTASQSKQTVKFAIVLQYPAIAVSSLFLIMSYLMGPEIRFARVYKAFSSNIILDVGVTVGRTSLFVNF